jgi:hypothetical protein
LLLPPLTPALWALLLLLLLLLCLVSVLLIAAPSVKAPPPRLQVMLAWVVVHLAAAVDVTVSFTHSVTIPALSCIYI